MYVDIYIYIYIERESVCSSSCVLEEYGVNQQYALLYLTQRSTGTECFQESYQYAIF